jgi:hypothetical protein
MNDSDLSGARTGGWLRHRRVSRLPFDPDQRLQGRGQLWLAVVATVAVVALVVMAARLTRSSGGTHSSNPGGAMATIEHAGKVLRYVGDGPWRDPVLDEDDPSIVYVYADQNGGTASWGAYCQATPVARLVSQTTSAVTVAVAGYAEPLPKPAPGTEVACPAIGLGAFRLKVDLAQPLGTRTLIDAHDGAAQVVLDPATVLKPNYLPAGYTGGQPTWADQPPEATTRQYQGPGSSLTVTIGPASLNRSAEHIIEHTTVRGHPAIVSNTPGFEQDILIAWSEDATHAAAVYQASFYEKAHPPLTADQLVRIANSLR